MGFAVNMMPEVSAGTITWTTTARLTVDGSIPCRARYSKARGVHKLDQHCCTAFNKADFPRTLRYVSCCPAKLAPGRSSAVADERTARGKSPTVCIKLAWA